MRELRLAVRALLRQRTFSLAVVSTLGLAMGVSAGFFGVVNALVLRPIPGVEARGLVNLYATADGAVSGFSGFSHPTFRDLRARTRSLAALEGFVGRGFARGAEAGGGVVGGQLVSGGLFELLGTRAMRGRLLGPADDRPGAEPVAVVTEALWQQRLGGHPDVVGRILRVNGRPITIVGVAEAGFRGHFVGFPLDVFLPLGTAPVVAADVDLEDRAGDGLELVARLRPGATMAAAQAELSEIFAEVAREHPASHRGRGVELRAYTGLDADLRGPVLGFVTLLSVVGTLVLLVACVNVGGLVLARGAARERELAVRAALGASPAQLVRPLFAETLVLFALGGLAGLAMTRPAARALHAFLPEFPIPLHLDVSPDWRVALFAGTLTLLAGLVFGLVPARRAARVDVVEVLKKAGRGLAGVSLRARRAFVAAEVALSLVLLVGAGLFLRELQRSRAFDPGFRVDGVGVVTVDASLIGRAPAARREFFEAWVSRVRSWPRVESASLVRRLPLGFGRPTTRVGVDGREAPDPEGFAAGWNVVSPGYFRTLEIPVLAGRDFDERDRAGGDRVAAVSSRAARRLYPGQEALGRYLRHEGHVLR
ncbi:MAG TPA: ABC transporter permease, partial [Vicinamibacteria bacterium]|nr:ABC transporter permease [Vicinamibacteria bacterium]